MFNWVGCCLGGARMPAADNALAALGQFSGKPEAAVLGRPERMDILHAAFLNGITSHVLDYDDTHLATIIHPAGPVAWRYTRRTTSGASTSRAPRACSAAPRRPASCSASTNSR